MKTTADQVHTAITQYGTWVSYGGTARVALGVGLLAAAAGVAYAAVRLPLPFRSPRPRAAARNIVIVSWLVSIVVLLVCLVVDLEHMLHRHLLHAPPVDPIAPVTFGGVVLTFVIILIAGRSRGQGTALAGAAIGAVVAPMIFELPFDLIVMARTYPPVPPDPVLVRALFFGPLLVVEVTTLALLTLSLMVRLSRAALIGLALMLGVFAIWGLLGFAYPSAPVPIALNVVSKLLAFVTTLGLFLPQPAGSGQPAEASRAAVPLMQCTPPARVSG